MYQTMLLLLNKNKAPISFNKLVSTWPLLYNDINNYIKNKSLTIMNNDYNNKYEYRRIYDHGYIYDHDTNDDDNNILQQQYNRYLIMQSSESFLPELICQKNKITKEDILEKLISFKTPIKKETTTMKYLSGTNVEILTVDDYYVDNCINNNMIFKGEKGYLDLLKYILESDKQGRETRNSPTYSNFGHQLIFDLTEGFPLLTSKFVPMEKVTGELLMFLSGRTDSRELEEKGNNIWSWNTAREFLDSRNLQYPVGLMGPMYGYNWRKFGLEYCLENEIYDSVDKPNTDINLKNGTKDKNSDQIKNNGVDQLAYVIDLLFNDENSRRIIMTTFDPSTVDKCVLYPCHGLITQFYVRHDTNTNVKYLDCSTYQRSADTFIGVPFNIASYALLVSILCKVTGFTPGTLIITFGDVHIYKEHLDAVNKQLSMYDKLQPLCKISLPDYTNTTTQRVTDAIKYIESLTIKDVQITDYKHGPYIKATMFA